MLRYNYLLDIRRMAVVVAALVLCGGCAHVRQYQPPVEPSKLSDTQFLHYLGSAPVVTYEEACRAVVIAADGEDRFECHADRVADLQGRGVVRPAWGLEGNHAVDAGTLAFMLFKVCDLPPNVNSVLLGSWGPGDRRFALKEATRQGIMPYCAAHKIITGGEVLAALAHADKYMAKKGMYDFDDKEINSPADVAVAQ